MRTLVGTVMVLVLLLAPAGFAQRAGTLNLDADLSTAGVQVPSAYSLAGGGNIVLYLVLTDVDDLIGVSADVVYDPAVLEIRSGGKGLTEDRGDVNFDGTVNVFDILKLVQERQNRDGGGTAVDYYDLNSSGDMNVFDILFLVQNRQAADDGINFWTNTRGAMALPESTESVEIFDNNVTGGLIDDLVAVLLIRPEGGVRDDTDRGFDSDAGRPDPAMQHATVARLEFEVKAASPTTTDLDILVGLTPAQLAAIGANANNAVVLHEGKTVDQLANPAANDVTITIEN